MFQEVGAAAAGFCREARGGGASGADDRRREERQRLEEGGRRPAQPKQDAGGGFRTDLLEVRVDGGKGRDLGARGMRGVPEAGETEDDGGGIQRRAVMEDRVAAQGESVVPPVGGQRPRLCTAAFEFQGVGGKPDEGFVEVLDDLDVLAPLRLGGVEGRRVRAARPDERGSLRGRRRPAAREQQERKCGAAL